MKKGIVLSIVMVVLGTMLIASGLRLGIGVFSLHSGGVQITDVYRGYPAAGYLYRGDIITHADIYSGAVIMSRGSARCGSIHLTPSQPIGKRITSAQQLQSIVLGAPLDSTVALWLRRSGMYYLFMIELLNPQSSHVLGYQFSFDAPQYRIHMIGP